MTPHRVAPAPEDSDDERDNGTKAFQDMEEMPPSPARHAGAQGDVEQPPLTPRAKEMTTKKKIKKALNEDPRITGILFLVIIFSTLCFILETHYPAQKDAWFYCEAVAVVIFTMEYTAQLVTDPRPLKYATDFLSLIDFLAICPFYLDLIIGSTGVSLSFLRAVRLFRVFRVAKLGKGSAGIKIVLGAFTRSAPVVGLLALVMLILIILFAALMVMVEGQSFRGIHSPEDCYTPKFMPVGAEFPDPQCVVFSSIPNAFWWAAVTMLTVGYGDSFPQSELGKAIAAMCMFAGILFISQPLAVVGANFQALMEVHREDQALMDHVDADGDGKCSEEELMEYLSGMRARGGKIPEKFMRCASEVMADYDYHDKGWLNQKEFEKLTEELVAGMEEWREPTTSEIMAQLRGLNEDLSWLQGEFTDRVCKLEGRIKQGGSQFSH